MSRRKKRSDGRCAARCRSAKSVPLFCACPPHPARCRFAVSHSASLHFCGAVARFPRVAISSPQGEGFWVRIHIRASPVQGEVARLAEPEGLSIDRTSATPQSPYGDSSPCTGEPSMRRRPLHGTIPIREKRSAFLHIHLIRLTAYALRLRFVSAEPSRASRASPSLPLKGKAFGMRAEAFSEEKAFGLAREQRLPLKGKAFGVRTQRLSPRRRLLGCACTEALPHEKSPRKGGLKVRFRLRFFRREGVDQADDEAQDRRRVLRRDLQIAVHVRVQCAAHGQV